ncbi:unnamed protein product [Didymodactylos carnosus]|uniref:Eukaryotic translation initiation factor 4E n=1 Tax=Didymodactylos carnosus TaxID=1234261 RepID=A0A813SUJ7_9BILA|nr:unnamed protein product [Didymodactylos carnosus]CAF0805587.1 unnamed protein product [Didymodactylos carnosus]CAF3575143.1 unnamed protein product [Didymodactylos carnosus]CAF3590980.1 unnamed protein product [Didymodactylos carnosus]
MPAEKNLTIHSITNSNGDTDDSVDDEEIPIPFSSSLKLHRLQYTWIHWFLQASGTKPWAECLIAINKKPMAYVEDFWATINHLRPPSQLTFECDYYLFRSDIPPLWESPTNNGGGRWLLSVPQYIADRYWDETLLALIGDQFIEESDENTSIPPLTDFIHGCAIQFKMQRDNRHYNRSGDGNRSNMKLALWTKSADNGQIQSLIGRRWRNILERNQERGEQVPQLTFYAHTDPKQRLFTA